MNEFISDLRVIPSASGPMKIFCDNTGAIALAKESRFHKRTKHIKAHCFPVTTRYSEKYPNHSEPFRCPNIAFHYMNLYLSTISRLLVMSVISSGTPNKLRSSSHITHNTNRHRMLSVQTLQVRELCRHDRDTSPVNNQ